MNIHPTDDLAAYALGVLDASERSAVSAHLSSCADCSSEVRSFSEVVWLVAQTEAVTPPLFLRDAVFNRAVRTQTSLAAPHLLLLLRTRFQNALRSFPTALPGALILLLLLSLSGNFSTATKVSHYERSLAAVAGGRIVPLETVSLVETQDTPLRGSLVLAAGGTSYLVLDLPTPPSGKSWQAWVLNGELSIPVGVRSTGGVATLSLNTALPAGSSVAITLEPAGGSRTPTSAPVLRART